MDEKKNNPDIIQEQQHKHQQSGLQHDCQPHSHQQHAHQQHAHQHHHSPEHLKAVSNRLARAIGHLESIKRMVEDDRDCSEILIQLMAVKAAINNTGKVILKEHMEHCLVHAIEEGDYQAIEEFNKAVEQFL